MLFVGKWIVYTQLYLVIYFYDAVYKACRFEGSLLICSLFGGYVTLRIKILQFVCVKPSGFTTAL